MSGQPPRKIPRIISRTKTKNSVNQDGNAKVEKPEQSGEGSLVKELNNEKVVVKDGCLVAVQQIDKGSVHGVVGATQNYGGHRFVINVPQEDDAAELYVENPLPGVADQVESYPCKFCPDSVFLTQFGLERHAKQHHPDEVGQISEEIEKIRKEWERREKERHRIRERAMLAKARHETYAINAVKYMQNGRMTIDDTMPKSGPERFEACKICNILINVKNVTAMDHHLRAHKKNDELKQQLIEQYGAETVNRLTCHSCRLVFTDVQKLNQHTENTHIRKRKYVCKYCGDICSSMTDLNMHKADVHAVNSVNSTLARTSHVIATRERERRIQQAAQPESYQKNLDYARVYRSGHEESVCNTECGECGLRLVRPSLLVRHMQRCHSKSSFECEIMTRGLPNIRIEVEDTKIYWWCCEQRYDDRHEFLFHRRQEHLEKVFNMMSGMKPDINEPEEELYNTKAESIRMQPSSSYDADLVHTQDGTFQVVLPEGLTDTDGQIYVLLPAGEEPKEHEYEIEENPDDIEHLLHEEPVHEEIVEDDGLHNYFTDEQIQELREQYGDQLESMIVYVNPDDLEHEQIIEEQLLEEHEHMSEVKGADELMCEEIFEA